MASIIERDGRFLVRVRRTGFQPVAKTFTRKQDATNWARRVEVDMESGRWRDPATEAPTLGKAIEQYRAGSGARLKGAATYAYWLDEVAESWLGRLPVDDVKPALLSRWRDELSAAGLKPGTVVRKLGMLSGVLTWCVTDRGWIATNPMRNVSKPCISDARDRTLSDAELNYLLRAAEACRAAWIGDALVVLTRSAMRRAELWRLRIEDVDFQASTAHLAETKNGSSRDVPLCPAARSALRRLADAARTRREEAKHRHDSASAAVQRTLHPNPATDGSIIPVAEAAAVSRAFRRTLARARRQYLQDCEAGGVESDLNFLANVRLHDLRHHAVSIWARTGVLSLVELQQVSGHKSLRMLVRYAHLRSEEVAAKMAATAPMA